MIFAQQQCAMGGARVDNHGAGGKLLRALPERDFGAITPCAVTMHDVVDLDSLGSAPPAVSVLPCLDKTVVGIATAQTAGPVTGCQCRCLIHEKKLCPDAGLHHRPPPVLVTKLTDDPGAQPPATGCQAECLIDQRAAIAQEHATRGIGENLTPRIDAIL